MYQRQLLKKMRDKKITCILCGGSEYKNLFLKDDYPIVKCKKCGLVYVNQKFSKEDIKEINKLKYSGGEYSENYLKQREYFIKRSEKFIRHIRKFKKRGKILDVGCSYGFFLEVAKKFGFDCLGVELSKEITSFARKHKLNVLTGTIHDFKFPHKFDIITMWDVLEHTYNPVAELKRTHELLKDSGLLVIQLPNIESFTAKLTKSDWVWLNFPYHLYHFSPVTLERLLKKTNFKILEQKTWEPYTLLKFVISALLTKLMMKKNREVKGRQKKLRSKSKKAHKLIEIFLILLYPLLKPLQLLYCYLNKGGLILVYCKKNH